jgi:diguanylate cyclase (GGDEF)-like protein/PAS domain S-box-containing protein
MERTANGSQGQARFARERLLDPFHLIAVPAVVVLLFAAHNGLTARQSDWKIVGAYLVSHLSATAFAARFPPGSDRAKPIAFLVLVIGTSGALLYVLGWGAFLAVALVPPAAVVVQEDGSRYGLAAIAIVGTAILLGEAGVVAGVFPSLLPTKIAHLFAFVEAGMTAALLTLLTRSQREKEGAEAREEATEARFRALVQYASDAIIVIADGGTVKYASPAVERLLGYSPDDLAHFDLSWIDPDHAEPMAEMFHRLREVPGATESVDVPVRLPDGSSRWFEVHFTNLIDDPAVGGWICNLRDIGERHNAQQQLMHDALHDTLTRLPNRRFFLDRLERAWHCVTSDNLVAVLFIDVDHFKQINDRLGHATGDHVLTTVAQCLQTVVRPNDLVARYAGDEFTVLLTDVTTPDDAFEIADRITTELGRKRTIDGHQIDLSVSVGVSTSRGTARSADELLRQADEAMYFAKRNGRGRWEYADRPDMRIA